MSTSGLRIPATPAPTAAGSVGSSAKPVPACSLCQQRKVRCDRQYPCLNCIKANAKCVPAVTLPRRRRRRLVDRELLERVKAYETLLDQHHIEFRPMAKDSVMVENSSLPETDDQSPFAPTINDVNDPTPEERTVWKAINQEFRRSGQLKNSSDEEIMESNIQSAWEELYDENDNSLFDTGATSRDVHSQHPHPGAIFRLWQIYLDNVNPLLKVTHSPSLQQQLVEASSDISRIASDFEALMFGIYCAAIMSATDEQCQNILHETKEVAAVKYHKACRQALINARFLRSHDMRVLTALLLYLLSVRQDIAPRSLHSMLGIAVRAAQRMGLDMEARNRTYMPFEAEMRRRLWWQIVLFDSRVGEIANHKASILTPAWDCKIPTNLNDSDLVTHSRKTPTTQNGPTEVFFVIVRCQIADFVRHTRFHLEIVSPCLKELARGHSPTEPSSLDELEASIEDMYHTYCDSQNPLHFISMSMNRSYMAKWRFAESVFKNMNNGAPLSLVARQSILNNTIRMIELDTEVQSSQLTHGLCWLSTFQFPFPAYIYLVQELRRTPLGTLADQAWEAVTINFELRELFSQIMQSSLSRPFTHLFLKAWEARETALSSQGETPTVPSFILHLRAFAVPDCLKSRQSGPSTVGVPPSKSHPIGSNHSIGDLANDSFANMTEFGLDMDQLGSVGMDWRIMGELVDSSLYSGGALGYLVEDTGSIPFSA